MKTIRVEFDLKQMPELRIKLDNIALENESISAFGYDWKVTDIDFDIKKGTIIFYLLKEEG